MRKPSPTKTSSISRWICVSRCAVPRGTGSPGSVTSTASARSAASSSRASKRSRSCGVQPLELAAHAVQLLAARSAQLGRQGAELAQRKRQRARAPERLDACVLELGGRGGPLELLAPLAFQAGRVLHGHPRVDAGTRETPPRYHPACAVPAPLASRPLGGVPPGSGGELRRTVRAGALSHGPAPCRGRRPPTRLRRRRSRHSTAYATRAAAPGGEPYERLGPLYDRWCAGVDHDIAVLRARLRGREPARSSSSARAAGASRSSSRGMATA